MVVHDYVELSALTVKLHQAWAILYLNINISGAWKSKEQRDEENNAPSF